MKKYGICLLLIVVTSVSCFFAGYWVTKRSVKVEPAIPNTTFETETVIENRQVINQQKVEPALEPAVEPSVEQERYYLVSETGFLLVFCEDKSTICLYTHIPITEFPEKEQDRLREGIWFSSMRDIYSYLESYTS